MNDVEKAWESISVAMKRGRLAHAYILSGDPQGSAFDFALRMTQALYCEQGMGEVCGSCNACRRVAEGNHPDVGWVEPQSKSRRILVDQVDQHIHRLHQTAYEGGWKVAGIRYSDRLNDDAANKFLKTLEEPPGTTLILLVTDAPHAMLATIRSRCQMIALEDGHRESPEWMDQLLVLLRSGRARSPLGRLSQAGFLNSMIQEVEAKEKERVTEIYADDDEVDDKFVDAQVETRVRQTLTDVFLCMQHWYRDLVLLKCGTGEGLLHFEHERASLVQVAEKLTLADCYRLLEQVETMRTRLDRNFPKMEVAEAGLM